MPQVEANVFTSFCFQTVPKPELTSATWIVYRHSQKWSQKCCHSLPFAAKVSDRCSFEQFHNLNKRQGSFPHNSIPPCNLYKWKVFSTACRNTAAYCIIFLTVWNSWLRQQISKIPSLYHWASAGMTKGNRLSKRKRNVLRRDDCFYVHHHTFQICITDQAWGQYDWIYGQIPFLHFARLSRSPLFFPGWLCHETSSLVRSLRDLMHWSSSSLTFKNLWEVEAPRARNRTNMVFSILRVGRLPRHWFISLTLPSLLCVNAKRCHCPLRDTIDSSRVFCSPNTLETRRLETRQFIWLYRLLTPLRLTEIY